MIINLYNFSSSLRQSVDINIFNLAMNAALGVVAEATLPFVVFWLCATYCMAMGYDNVAGVAYEKNSVTRREAALGTAMLSASGTLGNLGYYWVAQSAPQLRWLSVLLGLACVDAIQYWTHRMLHIPGLYERFHKKHHALKCPYSYGALYHDGVEATLISVPTAAVFFALGLLWHEYLAVTTLSYIATLRQHVYSTPNDQHWVHHERAQDKNFGQPFWDVWDRLCGTKYYGARER
jgi:sterol desaturase/sphingolipid hydroxylase (fatty acid hydroxylase superfamily)